MDTRSAPTGQGGGGVVVSIQAAGLRIELHFECSPIVSRKRKQKLCNLFCFSLTYCINFSRSKKEASSFLARLIEIFVPLAALKVLSFGKTQKNLAFRSLNRTFGFRRRYSRSEKKTKTLLFVLLFAHLIVPLHVIVDSW